MRLHELTVSSVLRGRSLSNRLLRTKKRCRVVSLIFRFSSCYLDLFHAVGWKFDLVQRVPHGFHCDLLAGMLCHRCEPVTTFTQGFRTTARFVVSSLQVRNRCFMPSARKERAEHFSSSKTSSPTTATSSSRAAPQSKASAADGSCARPRHHEASRKSDVEWLPSSFLVDTVSSALQWSRDKTPPPIPLLGCARIPNPNRDMSCSFCTHFQPQEAVSMPKAATSRTLGVRCSSRTAQQTTVTTAPWLRCHPFDGTSVPEFPDIAGLHVAAFLFCGDAALRVISDSPRTAGQIPALWQLRMCTS